MDRRNFLTAATLASIGLTLEAQEVKKKDDRAAEVKHEAIGAAPANPVMVCSRNGWNGVDKGYQMLLDGSDTLDSVISVGKTQEDDPSDDSVGLGGLPNEDGVVELDSCCMHGPTRRAGAVGGIHWTKNASLLGQAVMQHTGHVMLVAQGADHFARAMGFPKDDLLTDPLAQGLAAVEGEPSRQLVGTGPLRPELQGVARPAAAARAQRRILAAQEKGPGGTCRRPRHPARLARPLH